MTAAVLKTVTRTQGNNSALKEGIVKPEGFALEFEEVPYWYMHFGEWSGDWNLMYVKWP